MTVRTRFSPSPTGFIHIGNARAALFSGLYAKKNNGKFVLRIEDTDVARSEERYVDALKDDLLWLGVDWQEGPDRDGEYGPYWQSQRQDIYQKFYKQLEANRLIYPCFCSDQELQLARKVQLSSGKAPRYSGKCRQLSEAEVNERLAEGKKPAWRYQIPQGEAIIFDDLVKGPQSFKSDDIGDFIVRRADGTAPFMYCNAIDDAMMKVTHVLRGEDHLTNSPRQLLILKALGLTPPQYGHVSLITGDDGAPLSKRHGSFSVTQLREQGYLPEAIINYLARLGHVCEATELLSFDGLAEHFALDKLSRSPARFDVVQLNYWQKQAVRQLDADAFWRWVGERVANQVPLDKQQEFAEVIKANIEFPDEALEWAKIIFHNSVKIDEAFASIIQEAGEQFFVEAELAVDQYGTDIKAVLDEMKKTLNVRGKKLFMPVRIALTGKQHGPEMMQIAQLLGKEELKYRLGRAILNQKKMAN